MPVLSREDDTKASGFVAPIVRGATRVLVADDCPVSRSLYVSLLELHGFQASGAEDGREAIQAAMAGEAFDVILMDLNMPRCDGIQATKELRERGYKGIIYAFTAALPGQIRLIRELGAFDDCVPKPVSQQHILDFLQKLNAAPPDAAGIPAAKFGESSPTQ